MYKYIYLDLSEILFEKFRVMLKNIQMFRFKYLSTELFSKFSFIFQVIFFLFSTRLSVHVLNKTSRQIFCKFFFLLFISFILILHCKVVRMMINYSWVFYLDILKGQTLKLNICLFLPLLFLRKQQYHSSKIPI